MFNRQAKAGVETHQQRQQKDCKQHRDVSFDIYTHRLKAWQVHKHCTSQPEEIYRIVVDVASAAAEHGENWGQRTAKKKQRATC